MKGFKDIIGNDILKEQFSGAIRTGSISHAYMLSGDRGMGKKRFARAFCQELFCEHPVDGGACGICPSCKKVESGNHPDVIWLRAEKPEVIKVDEIRQQIVDTVDIRPFLGDRKIYIIPDADRMNPQAQNSLLKVLEEPSEYVTIFLLCCDEAALLETILSRVIRLKLKPRTDSMVKEYLKRHFPDAEDMSLDLAVAFSRGNVGRAEDLLSEEGFKEMYAAVTDTCRSLRTMDAGRIAHAARRLASECGDTGDVLDLMQLWYRDLMMYKVTRDIGGLLFKTERKAMMELAPVCSYEGIEDIMDALETCRTRLKANVNPELSFELMLCRMKENQ